jgi:hypothetical protein
MTSSVDEEIRGLALDRFASRLNDVYFFKERSSKVSEELDEETLAAEQSLKDALQARDLAPDGSSSESRTELQIDVDICLNQLVKVHDKPDVWRREVARTTAINFCMIFEVFLRNFLAEQLLLKPGKLSEYVKAQKKSWVASQHPLTIDYVADQIGKNRAFHAINSSVTTAYQSIAGRDPRQYQQTVALAKEDWTAALQDVELLFQIRHRLIHSDGHAGPTYQTKVEKYRERLNLDLRKKPAIPGPDDILRSQSVDGTEGKDKLDDFKDSLQQYARYIAHACGT